MFTSFNDNTILVLVWTLEGGALTVYFFWWEVKLKFVVNRSMHCASHKIIENRHQEIACHEKSIELFKSLTGRLVQLWIYLKHFILPSRHEVEH